MPPYRTITSPEEPDFDTNLWGTLWYFIHDYNAQQSKGLSRHHYYRITTDNINLKSCLVCFNLIFPNM